MVLAILTLTGRL